MKMLGFLSPVTVVIYLMFVVEMSSHSSHGWELAHATFYGGMNGRETMGM